MIGALCFLAAGWLAAVVWALGERRAARGQAVLLAGAWASERDELHHAETRTGEHLTAILSAMEEGVMVVDPGHTITLANVSLQRLFALKASPAGRTVLSILRLPQLQTMLHETLTDGHTLREEMAVAIIPGQPPVHFIVSTTPLRGAEGLLGGIVVFRDVSRLRKLEELRREFVANVSHELRTPLSLFQGHLETLLEQRAFAAAEVLPVLGVMRRHSLRLNALVEDLLTLTRLESRRDPLRREPLELPALFHDLALDWRPKAEGKSITLTTEVAAGTPPLLADPHRLRQVLDNLLENALNYTPPGGTVALRTRSGADGLELLVADSGAGIAPGDLPHIFERFFRADKARSRELGSTGLGLSIVKHIVLAHGGRVAAESTVGKGTTVRVTFPGEGAANS